MKRRLIFDPLPAPSLIEVANEAARMSRDSLAMALAAIGFKRAIFQAPRIGTPLWYEYAILKESLDTRLDRGEWPCLLLKGNRKAPTTWFCTVSADWKNEGAKGRGMISLASYTWEVAEHEAARRILNAVEPDSLRVRL